MSVEFGWLVVQAYVGSTVNCPESTVLAINGTMIVYGIDSDQGFDQALRRYQGAR